MAPKRKFRPQPSSPRLGLLIPPLVLGALVWFVFNASVLYLTYPPPWPDEALFADVSANLLHHGRMSTDLYAEFFPSMRQHYYLTPPLYHVLLAGWFGLFGFGIGALRAFSLLVAFGVIGATYAVARQLGLSRTSAMVPSALLALDAVFLRASLLGRMDLLALFFILLTVSLALGSMRGPTSGAPRLPLSKRALLLGITSALAVLTHPVGAVAAVVSVGWALAIAISSASERKAQATSIAPMREILLPTFFGLAIGLLPWAIYAFRDLHAWMGQMAGQLQRKSSHEWMGPCLSILTRQWGIDSRLLIGAFVSGTAGLVIFCDRRPQGLTVVTSQILLTVVVLSSCEMWYPLYVMPFTYIGLGCAMSRLKQSAMWQRGLGVTITAVALWFAQQNVARVSAIRGPRSLFYGADSGYADWCRQIGECLPESSTVLLDILPTPYFGLAPRHDLAFRLFPPAGFKVPEAQIRPSLERMDYIVGGRALANPEVRSFAMSHGEIVGEIGERRGPGYYAVVLKVTR